LEKDTYSPYIQDDILKNKQIKFLTPLNENELLIGTAANGIYLWNGEKLSRWNAQWTDYFIENELNRACVTNDDKIIAGTLIDGMVVFDAEGNRLMKVNAENGLPNNTVLGIETDEWGNIWLALDNGIGFVSGNQNPGFVTEEIPGTGAIYSVAILNDRMYLGTNQGLFVKSIYSDDNKTTLIPETQAQTWDCKIIDNQLWVGHNQGTFLVNGEQARLISSQSGGFSIKPDNQNENLLIQCTYNNLVTYKKTGSSFEYNGPIEGFADLIRYIEIDHLGNIWASHMHRGVYKIITDDNREHVLDTFYYGENIFGKDHSIHVFKIENRIVFTTNEQLYTYDDLNDTIVPYESLNQSIDKYRLSHRIIEAPNHHYWFISKNHIGLFSIFKDKVELVKEYPASLFNQFPLVDKFENILPLTEKTAILCLQNGIAHLDANIYDPEKIIQNYQPLVRQIELSTDRGRTEALPLISNQIKIRNNFHNVSFRFSFPRINEIPISYQYNLKGLSNSWSEKIKSPEMRFERLPKGEYTLQVRALDLWENESRIYEFSFEILPPWFTSDLAIIIYVMVLVVLLFLFRMWGIRQTQKREKLQHEKREQELIRLRNEKLRNEVEYKSKELANSTMSIIKKNEFLLELKTIIDRQKNELGSRYPDKYYNYLNNKIDKNISNQDDWQIFETNFERAHEQFFHKVKEAYPDLTSSDLRLCAYLRMNLSSKEIAPLLGISVRGVENHRYRLRKKLNLEHDESLTDTILFM
jgi:DNA-binding CsgD family transcriptional regulator